MFRYAQIDDTGNVISDSQLYGEVKADNMIPISDDFDLTNKKYINGKWVEYIPEPIEPEKTQLDKIEEIITNTALTTEYIACLQEVNAE